MEDVALKAALERWNRVKQDISSLRNKIAGEQAQLARLEEESADLDDWIAKWHEFVGRPIPPTAAERIENTRILTKQKRPKNPDKEIVVDEALQIIHDRGEPQSRRQLYDALAKRGLVLRGKDPEMVLSTMLWRSQDRIERLVPFGYWPAGVPYQPKIDLDTEVQKFDP